MHRTPYQTERFWKVLDGNLEIRKNGNVRTFQCCTRMWTSLLNHTAKWTIRKHFQWTWPEIWEKTKIKYSMPKMYTPNPLLNWSTLARFWCKFWERRFRKCLEIYMTWLWECLFSWAESPPLWHTQCRSEWFAKRARSAREQTMSGGLLSSCTWCITSSHVNCVYQHSVNEHRSTEDDTHGRRQCRTWHALQRACIRIVGQADTCASYLQ